MPIGSHGCLDGFGVLESRLGGGGVDTRKLKFTTLNILQAGVSVRIKSKSWREGKTNQPRNKVDDTMICFTEVRF
jgi:hypothetical protein